MSKLDKNDQTIQTYQQNFNTYIERTPHDVGGDFQKWTDAFLSKLPPEGQVLELGSAFGRDAKYMTGKGFKVLCTDIIPQALEKLAQEGFETAMFDFRDTPPHEWLNRFDGFFANAVLLHAPQDIFERAITHLLDVLKPGGFGAFSLKTGEGEEITNEKMDAPRYFKYHSAHELAVTLEKYPVEVVSLHTTDDGKWLHVIIKKS